jgi:hypothetical protein
MEFNVDVLFIIFTAFFVAGFTKGVVGLGLPPLVLGIVTASIGINSAMAVVALPALVTNLVQAVYGPQLKPILKTHSIFFLQQLRACFLGVGWQRL